MRCEQSRQWMSLALDNLLTEEEKAQLRAHLKECVGCRAEWRLLRMAQRVMATTPPVPMPYDLVPIVMERVKALQRERKVSLWRFWSVRPWRWALAVAMPFVLMAAILVGWRGWRSEPAPSESFYLSAHVVNAARTTAAPAFAPISLALSSVQFVGDETQ
ncbi:MAG: hypothetical protein OXFUSZZB_000109 [Candidatus Fervidibacter sp.]|mgnify:CR=1 FL=1|jgi:predicted anti-sigma-YlaC factor YlaD